jgi:1-acylglycerone phosphate reductase
MSPARKKVALVTGGSSGIGYATAIELAKRGYKVYAAARRLEPMNELKRHGIIPVKLDVVDLEDIKHIKELIERENDGYLDLLFNNAGQVCNSMAIDVPDEWMKQCFEVNVYGPIRVTRELAPLFIKAKGTVAFTGSVAGIIPFIRASMYSASKAAISSYCEILEIELKPLGVKVVHFYTGAVQTAIADNRTPPQDSYYNVPEMVQSEEERKDAFSKMPVEVYAKKTIDDIESQTLGGNPHRYRGKSASFAWILSAVLPWSLIEYVMIRNLKLDAAFKAVEKKYKSLKYD